MISIKLFKTQVMVSLHMNSLNVANLNYWYTLSAKRTKPP